MNITKPRWIPSLITFVACLFFLPHYHSIFQSMATDPSYSLVNNEKNQLGQNKIFYTALESFFSTDEEKRVEQDKIKKYLDKTTLKDLENLRLNYGSQSIINAVRRLSQDSLLGILRTHGEDFFILTLQTTIEAENHLNTLEKIFEIDSEKFTESVKKEHSRFTGAMLIMESIDLYSFNNIVQVFSRSILPDAFTDTFYQDPYLLISAINIISNRDLNGTALTDFFNYLPNNEARTELFKKDLPGLVVAFSTLLDVKIEHEIFWIEELLEIQSKQLSELIEHHPAELAYVIYGGSNIGIDNLRKLINSIGQKRFQLILENHTLWLSKFLMGLNKVSFFSSNCNFLEIKEAIIVIEKKHPYLLEYNSYLPPYVGKISELFKDLPPAHQFLSADDRAVQARIYLLGLISIYQKILFNHTPQTMLSQSQFELLKTQILYSTRFSENLNNMISNFEVGTLMVKNSNMESVILFLAHELAHQIFSIFGFNSPLLSTASIHELNSDIAARSIAQNLDFWEGMIEYRNDIFFKDDYSTEPNLNEVFLIASNDSHIIGRTQLGFLINGFNNSQIIIDWESLFAASLIIVKGNDRMKNSVFIRKMVACYMYCLVNPKVTNEILNQFIDNFENTYTLNITNTIEVQIANAKTVEEIIRISNDTINKYSLALP